MAAAVLILAALAVASAGATSPALAYDAPDDCDWILSDDLSVSLTCHLSAINSPRERTNFTVIPSERTQRLTIRCEDSDSPSSLEADAFASLVNLRELNIERCRIELLPANAFRGLAALQKLVVKTSNAARTLVEANAFAGLDSLLELDLSENAVSVLPIKELCNVPKLTSLNVSHNVISTVSDLSLTEGCVSNLNLLDASHNSIVVLDNSLGSAKKLRTLKLASNLIQQVEKNALQHLAQLEVLDLCRNKISLLPSVVFKPSNASAKSQLSELNLSNNSISRLEDGLLDGLSALRMLDLSGNRLASLPSARLTRDLTSVVELSISANILTGQLSSDNKWLSAMTKMETLRLNDNQLDSVASSVFASLEELKELDLSGNRLSALHGDALHGLTKLSHLHLGRNKLSAVDAEAFANCSNVLVLDLSQNQLTSVPAALRRLKAIQTLDLSSNAISSLDGASILDMAQLWRLQLSHNRLQNVTAELLAKLSSLQILDLSANQIAVVERGAFDANKKLQAVRLDDNRLSAMDGLFAGLDSLTWLNVSSNQIVEFDYAMVPRGLHWLDISRNKLVELANYFDLTGEIALAVLDASFNDLRQLGPNSIPDSIETLLVNDNEIDQIVPYTFFKKGKLTKVDLTVNALRSIDRNALRLSTEISRVPEFYLGGNPVECDCEMVWFKTINTANTAPLSYPVVKDIESIYCRLVYTREISFVPLVEARNEQFLCPYQTHCFPLCKCCDFDACDCEMSCPDNCTCFHDASWSKNIAVCSASGFTDLPDLLPMDATEVYLDGNVLTELGSHSFIGRKNMRVLHLNDSHISTIRNNTFNGLQSLTVLHLENNQLTTLRGFEFSSLRNLRELYLQSNMIESVHNATFKFLRSLEVLHLHGNRIIDFPVWQLAFNPFLVSIKLAENLWSCECEFMERYRSWMAVYTSRVFDSEAVSCVTNEADAGENNIRIVDFDVSTCASMQAAAVTNHERYGNSKDYLLWMAGTLAGIAIILLVLLVIFVHRHTLRVWIYSKCGVRVFDNSFSSEDEAECGKTTLDSNLSGSTTSTVSSSPPKLYDIYVSYSPKDDIFVREMLSAELENGAQSQYRVCLHHRDVGSGGYMFVADAVVQAAEASRRTIVVLSQNFLASEWSRYDYKSGLHQAMRSGARRKLIFVLLGDVNTRHIDPDLRLYLKTSIVLNWGDRLFWEKLRYALPDVPLSKSSSVSTVTMPKSVSPNHIYGINQGLVSGGSEEHIYHQPRYGTTLSPSPTSNASANAMLLLNNNMCQRSLSPASGGGHYYVPNQPSGQMPGRSSVVLHL